MSAVLSFRVSPLTTCNSPKKVDESRKPTHQPEAQAEGIGNG